MAAATPWQDVAPGARLRLITSDVLKADGTTLVGLELDMPDTYKTYWRLPGETGIPTELDIKGSAGVTGAEIGWPYPTPEMSAGFLDYVYHGPTVLPVVLHISGDAPVLSASVLMGVCSEVCVPAKAQFNLPLTFGQADMAEGIRLAQAEALVPIAWTAPDAPFSALRYDAAAHGVSFAVNDPGIDPASIILSTSDPTVIFDAPQKSPDGRTMLLALRAKDAGTQWAKQPIRLTFMTPKGSFDISEQVTAP
jgi:DsbC/DsbD-like thiol-disulfide interchange protein